jgi:hypothetical protein
MGRLVVTRFLTLDYFSRLVRRVATVIIFISAATSFLFLGQPSTQFFSSSLIGIFMFIITAHDFLFSV